MFESNTKQSLIPVKDKPIGSRFIWARISEERKDPLFLFFRWGIIITFMVMVVAALLQVISRYFFNYPLGWTGELAQIMMIWFAFLTVPILARRRRLMRVDALLIQLSPYWRTCVNGVINLLSAMCIGWMAYLSVRLMNLAGSQVSTALKIPYPYIYLSITLGLSGATIYFIYCGISDFLTMRDNTRAGSDVQRQMDD